MNIPPRFTFIFYVATNAIKGQVLASKSNRTFDLLIWWSIAKNCFAFSICCRWLSSWASSIIGYNHSKYIERIIICVEYKYNNPANGILDGIRRSNWICFHSHHILYIQKLSIPMFPHRNTTRKLPNKISYYSLLSPIQSPLLLFHLNSCVYYKNCLALLAVYIFD